jgi:hypothetical protein
MESKFSLKNVLLIKWNLLQCEHFKVWKINFVRGTVEKLWMVQP